MLARLTSFPDATASCSGSAGSQVVSDSIAQGLLHLVEVRAQVVDAQRAGEVRLVSAREQLGHVVRSKYSCGFPIFDVGVDPGNV